MPECLKCKTELKFDDTINTWIDEENIEKRNLGYCPKCKKQYTWTDIYKYSLAKDIYEHSHFKDLEEGD